MFRNSQTSSILHRAPVIPDGRKPGPRPCNKTVSSGRRQMTTGEHQLVYQLTVLSIGTEPSQHHPTTWQTSTCSWLVACCTPSESYANYRLSAWRSFSTMVRWSIIRHAVAAAADDIWQRYIYTCGACRATLYAVSSSIQQVVRRLPVCDGHFRRFPIHSDARCSAPVCLGGVNV